SAGRFQEFPPRAGTLVSCLCVTRLKSIPWIEVRRLRYHRRLIQANEETVGSTGSSLYWALHQTTPPPSGARKFGRNRFNQRRVYFIMKLRGKAITHFYCDAAGVLSKAVG